MVVIRLKGGTGNQFFQYAFGRALQAVGNDVYFDRYYFGVDGTRGYTLDHYNTDIKFHQTAGPVIPEHGLRYDPDNVRKYSIDCTLDGYWQCEKYFLSVADKIRRDLILRNPVSEKTEKFRNLILGTPNSVFYHIRRTDNLSQRALSWHGYLPDSYYDRARAYIEARIPNRHYFIFSDDINWCKENIRIPNSTFVDANTPGLECDSEYVIRAKEGTQHEDLYLMSLCQHSIVGNSTFSWWAAWLNNNPDKIVTTPDEWFIGNNNHLSLDIIPESWKRL
jgi:hypothetical protein